MKLTQKQEGFCLKYIETGNASEAYRANYDTKRMNDNFVWKESSRLLSNSKVSVRIAELQEELKKKSIVTAEMKIKLLWDMAVTCAKKQLSDEGIETVADPNAARGCVSELNKMQGDLAPTKTENKHDLSITHEEWLEQLK